MPSANSDDRRTEGDEDSPKRRRRGRRGGRRNRRRDDELVSAEDRRADAESPDADEDELLTDSIVAAVAPESAAAADEQADDDESADDDSRETPVGDEDDDGEAVRDEDVQGVVVEARTSARERAVEPGQRARRPDGGRGQGRSSRDTMSPPTPKAKKPLAADVDDEDDDAIELREVEMSRADQAEESSWEGDEDDDEIIVSPSDKAASRPAAEADAEPIADDEDTTPQAVTVDTVTDLRLGGGRGVQEMLINVADPDECRISLVTDGRLDELYMERKASASHVGNIYKGRVTNVEPSIQAAFIDFGLPVNGFLHISDLHPQYFPGEQDSERVGRKTPRRDRPPIQRCLRRGDEVIVQITKEGIGTKGPTMTTYLSLPGRFLVMMPGMAQLGVSRKIEDEDARRKARQILSQLRPPRDIGFIVRTAGIDRTQREIQGDLNYLTRLWRVIERRIKTDRAPSELYQESDLIIRTIRDAYDSEVHRIVVDDEQVAQKVAEFLSIANPRGSDKVIYYAGREPLFHRLGIEQEIEKLHSRHVPLPCGGSLVIDSAEALVAIDVNSGKFRLQNNADESALRVNLEAADEIARQLRLRDLGGVIICDFIDMRQERHRRMVENRLTDALKDHKERAKILRMSRFGIIEMTRQRQRPSFSRSVYQDCPHCHGRGLVKTVESMTLDVMRVVQYAAHQENVHLIDARVAPSVAAHVQNRKRHILSKLESETGKTINITAIENYGADQVSYTCLDRRGRDIPLNIFANGVSPTIAPGSGPGTPPRVVSYPAAAPQRPMLSPPASDRAGGGAPRDRESIVRPTLPARPAAAGFGPRAPVPLPKVEPANRPTPAAAHPPATRPPAAAPKAPPASDAAPTNRPAFGQPRAAKPASPAPASTRPVDETRAPLPAARSVPPMRDPKPAAPPAAPAQRVARPTDSGLDAPLAAAHSAPAEPEATRPAGADRSRSGPMFPPPPPPPARPAARDEIRPPAPPVAAPPPSAPKPAAPVRADGLDHLRFGSRPAPFGSRAVPTAPSAVPPTLPVKAAVPTPQAPKPAVAKPDSAASKGDVSRTPAASARAKSFASSLFDDSPVAAKSKAGRGAAKGDPATPAMPADDEAALPADAGDAKGARKKKPAVAKKKKSDSATDAAPAVKRTAKAKKSEPAS